MAREGRGTKLTSRSLLAGVQDLVTLAAKESKGGLVGVRKHAFKSVMLMELSPPFLLPPEVALM
jgi:hypothetical protein